MRENRSELLKIAMGSGLSMGLFWCFKYIFFMFGISSAFMNFIYLTLTIFVPIMAFYQTWRYKIDIGGSISFFHAWQFGVLVYFFAALIVSLEHYFFYQYIAPPGFLAKTMEQTIEVLKMANADEKMLDTISKTNISPIQMAIQGIFNNIFYGVILSLPVAWVISRRKETFLPPTPPDITDENN